MNRQGGTLSGCCARTGLVFLLGCTLVGCGGSERETATVTGTVTYQGAPVPAGKVMFFGPNDQNASAVIEPDGSYEAKNVPLGQVKVAVSTPVAPPPEIEKAAREGKRRFGKGNVIQAPPKTVAIPAKYGYAAKSGLSLTVTGGSQTFPIELK